MVDFVILGAQKCGTTTLWEGLRRHPRLAASRDKETDFFSTSPDWRREIARYEAQFAHAPGTLRFEASTSYTFFPHRRLGIWDDLYAHNPALRLAYIVREPVARLVSAYMHNLARGWARGPIDEEVFRRPLYLDATRYATQIAPFVARFGAERVKILFFEDLAREPDAVFAEIARFLEIEPVAGLADGPARNRSIEDGQLHHRLDLLRRPLDALGRVSPALQARTRRLVARAPGERPRLAPSRERAVRRLLRLEIDALEAMTGRDLEAWRRPVVPEPAPADA